MGFYPSDDFVIDTNGKPDAVRAALAKHVDAPKFLGFNEKNTFVGKATEDGHGFVVRRVLDYRNSFQPQITVRVESGPLGGTRVFVAQRVPAPVLLFMTLWLLGVGFGALAMTASLFAGDGLPGVKGGETAPKAMLLIPYGMLIFAVALTRFGFGTEAKKTRIVLAELLGAPVKEIERASF